ncbi:MAG: terpene cyclase/mutase family protein [Planctomycetes bacterium]|nr:terpene cyclase/mutase family protein [Planctomycetota bacterium]
MSDLLPPGIPQLSYDDLKDELISYLHDEKTAFSRDIIEYYIEHDNRLNQAFGELTNLTKLLKYTPEVEPSRSFHRRVARALPDLRHTHKVSTNLQNLITETGWGIEERILFVWAYLKFSVKQRPSSILSLCGMILFLVTSIAILPKIINSNSYFPNDFDIKSVVIPDVLESYKPIVKRIKSDEKTTKTLAQIEIPNIEYVESHKFRKFDFDKLDYPEKHIKKPEKFIDPNILRKIPIGRARLLIEPKLQVLNWFSKRVAKDKQLSKSELDAIESGLDWLAGMQQADGSFRVKNLEGNAEKKSEITPGITSAEINASNADIILTALAALSFITEGYSSYSPTPTKKAGMTKKEYSAFRKKFARNRLVVRNAVNFLKCLQTEDGFLARFNDFGVLAHSISLLAMIEDRITYNNWRLVAAIRNGVNFLIDYQNFDGGWGHSPADNLSLLQPTFWSITALKTAAQSDAELLSEKDTVFTKVLEFFTSVSSEEGYFGESSTVSFPDGHLRPTAEGLALDKILHNKVNQSVKEKSIALLTTAFGMPKWEFTKKAPNGTFIDYDYWFFGTLVMNSGLENLEKKQLKLVETWNDKVLSVLIGNQFEDGSWQAINPHSDWGQVYSTSMVILTLQNKYRYSFN